jgi:hypothetical protein
MYPAIFTPDSYAVLEKAIDRNNSFGGSAGTTLPSIIFLKIFSLEGRLIVGVTIMQSILIYIAIYLWLEILAPIVKKKARLLMVGVLFLTPFFGPLAVTIWKDVPYIAFTMIGLAKITSLTSNQFQKNLGYVLITLGSTFRHEGFLIIGIAAVILMLLHFFLKFKRKTSAYGGSILRLFICSAFVLLITNTTNHLFNIESPGNFYKTQAFFLDLEHVHSNFPEKLPNEIRGELEKISTKKSLVGFNSCADTQNFISSDFNLDYANQIAWKMPKYWLEAMNSNAREELTSARICRSSSNLLPFFANKPVASFWPTVGMSPNDLRPDRPFIVEKVFYPAGWLWAKIWQVNGNLIGWPGLHLSFILFFVFSRFIWSDKDVFKIENVAILIPLSFLIARSLVLFGTVPSQEFRFFAHVYFISIPLGLNLALRFLARMK